MAIGEISSREARAPSPAVSRALVRHTWHARRGDRHSLGHPPDPTGEGAVPRLVGALPIQWIPFPQQRVSLTATSDRTGVRKGVDNVCECDTNSLAMRIISIGLIVCLEVSVFAATSNWDGSVWQK